jgi:hypothetical protein
MTIVVVSDRVAARVTEEYARSQKNKHTAISMSAALRAVRGLLPDGHIDDKDLTKIVASKVIARGHAVEFDTRREK